MSSNSNSKSKSKSKSKLNSNTEDIIQRSKDYASFLNSTLLPTLKVAISNRDASQSQYDKYLELQTEIEDSSTFPPSSSQKTAEEYNAKIAGEGMIGVDDVPLPKMYLADLVPPSSAPSDKESDKDKEKSSGPTPPEVKVTVVPMTIPKLNLSLLKKSNPILPTPPPPSASSSTSATNEASEPVMYIDIGLSFLCPFTSPSSALSFLSSKLTSLSTSVEVFQKKVDKIASDVEDVLGVLREMGGEIKNLEGNDYEVDKEEEKFSSNRYE